MFPSIQYAANSPGLEAPSRQVHNPRPASPPKHQQVHWVAAYNHRRIGRNSAEQHFDTPKPLTGEDAVAGAFCCTPIGGRWLMPSYSGRDNSKAGRGPDSRMQYASMKQELKVIAGSNSRR